MHCVGPVCHYTPRVMLVVDEAHATLVCGARGGGAVEAAGIGRDVDLHVGTLSKAFGSHGGGKAKGRFWGGDCVGGKSVSSFLLSTVPAHVRRIPHHSRATLFLYLNDAADLS